MKKIMIGIVIFITMIFSSTSESSMNCKCPRDGMLGIYVTTECDGWGCRTLLKCCYGHYFYCD